MKPLVYIASPYTKGDEALNVRTQMKVFDELLNEGVVLPFAPLMSHFQHMMFPRPYEDWIKYDLEILRAFDALLRIPAVESRHELRYFESESSGADREVQHADAVLGIPVFHYKSELYQWAIETRLSRESGD